MAAHVAAELGTDVSLVLDDGACTVGLESTILDLTSGVPMLLRPGGVTREELIALFGEIASPSARDHVPRAPGSLPSHYAPSLPVRLPARRARRRAALLAFGAEAPAGCSEVLWPAGEGDLAE